MERIKQKTHAECTETHACVLLYKKNAQDACDYLRTERMTSDERKMTYDKEKMTHDEAEMTYDKISAKSNNTYDF